MDHDYEALYEMQHPDPKERPRMSMTERAAQFSPFAALTGLNEAMDGTQEVHAAKVAAEIEHIRET